MMEIRIPEKHKKPGVCYAVTEDGIELPVIDITHPAFAVEMTAEQISDFVGETARGLHAMKSIPPEVWRSMAAGSMLVRGWVECAGTYMTGMITYLNRLGPDNLGDGYAGPLDRQAAAGLVPLSFRFRLRDIARLLADALAPALAARPSRPVRLLNIAGGPAADSLNALILVHREHPELLPGRRISIDVLDIDTQGPAFGARALQALSCDGGPLGGTTGTLSHLVYNWSDPSGLRALLAGIEPGAIAAGSTEGGLFDYGSDDEIVANLSVLREYAPADFLMAGSVVRGDDTMDPRLQAAPKPNFLPAIRSLGLEAFRPLAEKAGWVVDRVLDSVAHHAVTLRKA